MPKRGARSGARSISHSVRRSRPAAGEVGRSTPRLVSRAVARTAQRPMAHTGSDRFSHVLVDEYPTSVRRGAASRADRRRAREAHGVLDDDGPPRMRAAAAKKRARTRAAHPDAQYRLECRSAVAAGPMPRWRRARSPTESHAARADASASASGSGMGSRRESPERRSAAPSPSALRAADERAQAQASRPRSSGSGARLAPSGSASRACLATRGQITMPRERALALRPSGRRTSSQAEVRDVLTCHAPASRPGRRGRGRPRARAPPIALRSIDIARCVQIARRRKLDWSPRCCRDRVAAFARGA